MESCFVSLTPPALTVRQEIDDKLLLLKMAGEVTHETVDQLREVLLTACEYAVTRRIVLDARGINQVSSEGLSLLTVASLKLIAYGRPLFVLLIPGSQMDRVLCLSQIPNLIPITANKVAAMFFRSC